MSWLSNQTYVESEEWVSLPPNVIPQTITEGQGTGNKYGVIKGDLKGTPVQIYLGVQHLYSYDRERKSMWHPKREPGTNLRMDLTPTYHLYIEVTLPYTSPHMRVHAKPNFRNFTDGEAIRLEGDFNDTFSIETNDQNGISAYEALPPDTMVQLLNTASNIGLEYARDKLYIELPLSNPWIINGKYIKFSETWADIAKNVSAALSCIEELVYSARTAAIHDDEFQLIEQKWNKTTDPKQARRRLKILKTAVSLIILTGAGFFMFQMIASFLQR